MRRYAKLLLSVLLTVSFFQPAQNVYAQLQGMAATQVSAQVGEFYLNVYGYISPYASVALLIDNALIQATVADAGGNFTITQVLIKRGLTKACFYSVDFYHIGDSTACVTFPPANADVTLRDVFLPPSLGVSAKQFAAGSPQKAFGYTMPGSKVTLYIGNGQTITTTADQNGYFQFSLQNLPPGGYDLYARSVFNGKESLAPTKKVHVQALGGPEQALSLLQKLWNWLINLLTSSIFGPLWLIIPLLIIILLLLRQLFPQQFTSVEHRLLSMVPFKRRDTRLHHWWFVGY